MTKNLLPETAGSTRNTHASTRTRALQTLQAALRHQCLFKAGHELRLFPKIINEAIIIKEKNTLPCKGVVKRSLLSLVPNSSVTDSSKTVYEGFSLKKIIISYWKALSAPHLFAEHLQGDLAWASTSFMSSSFDIWQSDSRASVHNPSHYIINNLVPRSLL